MKLLFKDENKSELKDLLGFIDADFLFKNIKSDIITATREVMSVIGKEVYDKAVGLYESTEDLPDDDIHFLYMVRYPIAVQAYWLYAPSNDLSHTNNGRRMRIDDHEKQAFEWMLDRDNDSIEKRYYRAIDDLIIYLEEYDVNEWKDSDAYKKQKELFVFSTPDFDEIFPIKSRLLFLKLMPGLKQCQENEIKPRLGEKYLEIQTKLKSTADLTAEEKILMYAVKKAMVFYSLSWAMPRLSINLFPEGILQAYRSERSTTNSRKPALKLETQEAAQAFSGDFEKVILEIERLMAPPVVPDPNCKSIDPKIITGDNFISL